jgi:streptomycin 6-kinase
LERRVTLFPDTLAIYDGLSKTRDGRDWLAALPSLVHELAAEWEIELGEPFHGGSAAWVASATLNDGTPAVLKVSWPHREAREEGTGLALWNGNGACRVLREDRDRYALLLERCVPGIPLNKIDRSPEERLLIAAAVLNQLWIPAPEQGFELVADVTAEWAQTARERMDKFKPPFDAKLVDDGIQLLETLPNTAARSVLIHGDFNPGNVLSAARVPWLAIDAKPMVGDPGYDPGPLLLQVDPPLEYADPAPVLRDRYRLFADAVGEPAERLLQWSLAREVESALWYVSRGDLADGVESMSSAAIIASLL